MEAVRIYYRHISSGKLYFTDNGGHAKMKLLGVWADVIIYHCAYVNPDGQTWVRSVKDFQEHFKIEEYGGS